MGAKFLAFSGHARVTRGSRFGYVERTLGNLRNGGWGDFLVDDEQSAMNLSWRWQMMQPVIIRHRVTQSIDEIQRQLARRCEAVSCGGCRATNGVLMIEKSLRCKAMVLEACRSPGKFLHADDKGSRRSAS